eukprot:TRINITY_DN15570_c0_g1_i1.p1 TRINITY_DN15570_c0_g1~~TRINITY_DN15570_c0_g1_i1.p1  ORF type:complete len:560 (-),score=115.82 TRINITY_DN15570_c0_g1_i1:16-1482(-)
MAMPPNSYEYRYTPDIEEDVNENHARKDGVCNNVGINEPYEYVCTKKECVPALMLCKQGNSVVQWNINNTNSYNGDYRNCNIQKVMCSGDFGGNTTFYTSTSDTNCELKEVSCNGQDTPINQIPNNFQSECHINSMLCGSTNDKYVFTFIPTANKQKYCVSSNLQCGGQVVNSTPYVYNPSLTQCNVIKSTCPPAGSCTYWFSSCLNSTFCTYTRYPCIDACSVPNTKNYCKCPLDFKSPNCDSREIKCSLTLTSPQPNCKPTVLFSDPPCFIADKKESMQFYYRINCTFSNMTGIDVDNYPTNDGFTYFVRMGNTKFAISSQSPYRNWNIQQKIYDFVWFAEQNATNSQNLTKNQIIGFDPIEFSLDFSKIPSKYFVGNRIYFETSFPSNNVPGGLVERPIDARFIDFTDTPNIHKKNDRNVEEDSFESSSYKKSSSPFNFDNGDSSNYLLLLLVVPGVLFLFFIMISRRSPPIVFNTNPKPKLKKN